VRVGVFVTIALILAIGVIIALTDITGFLVGDFKTYAVRFDVSSGVSNIQEGAEVRVGGLPMGSVVSVEPEVDADRFATILIGIELDARLTLYDDAEFILSTALLGAEAWLDCPSVGHPNADGSNALMEDGIVNATPAPGMLTALMGPDGAKRTEVIMAEIQHAVEVLNEHGMLATVMGGRNVEETDALVQDVLQAASSFRNTSERFEADSGVILDNVKLASGDARDVVALVKNEQWPSWSESISGIFEWADSATADIDATMEEGRLMFADTRSLINDNRATIDGMVADAGELMAYANSDLKERVAGLLDRGDEGLENAVAVLQRAKTDYEAWSTDLDETLGNASLMSQQLKLATIEIRRSPWKLLYKPTDQELAHEHLYEATRSFAVAAADMKAASLSVDRILQRYGTELAADQELFDRITGLLVEPLDRYETAQERLFDVLVTQAK
jgi:hypothetical protein